MGLLANGILKRFKPTLWIIPPAGLYSNSAMK
jgi:hypothetical protein